MRRALGKRTDTRVHVRRGFVRVRGLGVHYLRAGSGPPVVLLHAGVSSASSLLPLLQRLAPRHTVFAVDHPGYGDSDPLPQRQVRIADTADALKNALVALKLPRCPVYGSHTGGAVALELARRHPARVAAVVVDGPTVFRPDEAKFFVSDEYLPPFKVKDDGSHLFASWVKSRDTSMWFPWCRRRAPNRRATSFPSADALHERIIDVFRAGDGYRAVYGAAFQYDAREAVAALRVPATFIADADDLLFSHLDRLPRLGRNQRIVRHAGGYAALLDEVARILLEYRVRTKTPAEPAFRASLGAIHRRYVDIPAGQVLVRSGGETRNSRPLLLLHEGRASSRVLEPLMRELARHRPVYAPDLPDNGASDALGMRRPSVGDYADAVLHTAAALRLGLCDIYAVGAGAAVALALLTRPAFAKTRVVLEAPDFYAAAVARRLAREWAPPLRPEWDGAHLNRLWLMLRDEYAFWPWFDRSTAAACAMDAPADWGEMQARVAEIVRSLPTYHRLTAAALRDNWMERLRRARARQVTLAAVQSDPRRTHAEAAARLAGLPKVAELPAGTASKAKEILRILRGTKHV